MNSVTQLKETFENNQAVEFLMSSKIGGLFNERVSEVSYNGELLFINETTNGRKAVNNLNLTNEDAYFIVKHLADLGGKAFNNLNPILDLSFGNFRLNAIHDSIAISRNLGVINFIIRQIFDGLRIGQNKTRINSNIDNLFEKIISSKSSVIISGVTGSGKTELQKYLVSKISKLNRIIMIEETYETKIKELFPNLDINIWQLSSMSNHQNLISELIRAGLRNNPDWLMLAEARGNETNELLLTATSGIPVITTIHAQSAFDAIDRMIQLIGNLSRFEQKYLEKEIANYFHFYIHMDKSVNHLGKIERSISQIMICYLDNQKVIKKLIYSKLENKFSVIDKNISRIINIKEKWYES